MAYEMKPGTGSAFKNDKKTEDWHGDLSGKIMLPDGKTYYVNVYNKIDKNNNPYITFKIGKEVAGQSAAVYSAAHQPFPPQTSHDRAKANGFADLDDDLPPF